MEEGTSGGGGESSSRAAPSYVKLGDRDIFTVELRPGETTFVSWKKLMRDANKVNGGSAAVPEAPPANAHPNLESRLAPGQPAEPEGKDGPTRFGAVIEKIERLYMGKDSSDDEDLKDVPDDDQYDTDDSFIDDAELDEYFEVDNSAIKHDGFFVNRGKLERITEPPVQLNQQPKKRRKKDKAAGENDDGHTTKIVKMSKVAVSKAVIPQEKNTSDPSQSLVETREHHHDVKSQNLLNSSGVPLKRKSAESKTNMDPSSLIKVSNGGTSMPLAEANDINKPRTEHSKNLVHKSKDLSLSIDASYQNPQLKVHPSKSISNANESDPSSQSKEKNGVRELPDLNKPDGRVSMQVIKPSHVHKKEGSCVRSKSAMLENAIRDLEKMVAESRPPVLDNQDVDNAAQATKRRLPREVKLKLAKVARLAASQGKVSKELLNRLMSILGHLMQLRTLKRNLKVMISMGGSAKQEKDVRFQQVKKEVAEMIKKCAPSDSKLLEQQPGASDDFQETGCKEKGALKRKFSMDAALEDKICDLYDLFIDGLDEDAGPQVRKLYIELAELWPSGCMDNHGIKRAICRAKERRRALYSRHKEEEKIKRKKLMAARIDEPSTRAEAGSITQQRLDPDTSGPAVVRAPSPPINAPSSGNTKQEKSKGTSSNPLEEAKLGVDPALVKKKVKRKPQLDININTNINEMHLVPSSSEERHKYRKPINLELNAPSNFQ